ncbi:MAG: putative 2OG-Fe(II) oxygenase [Legionella sp.]|nr:putative 2OG-Fe(II) oxygenase [Legionella sp.]
MKKTLNLSIAWKQKVTLRALFNQYLQKLSKQPNNEQLKIQIAQTAYYLGEFNETLNHLKEIKLNAKNKYIVPSLSAKAYLAINTNMSNLQALPLLHTAKENAPDEVALSETLTHLGIAHQRISLAQKAIRFFSDALTAQPFNSTAFNTWAAIDFSVSNEAEVLERCDDYITRGMITPTILANRYTALSLLGRTEEAEWLSGINAHTLSRQLEGPIDGESSLDDFLSKLALELSKHPALRYGRHDSAIKLGWRIDELLTHKTPALSALFIELTQMISKAIDDLPNQPHPWLTNSPSNAKLTPWCLFTENDEEASWHVHPRGWMSGVFYILVPDVTKCSYDKKGCIEFGPPTLSHIQRKIPGEHKIVKPKPGQLLLFPSHLYHRTYATQNGHKRLVIPFDIQPLNKTH